MAALWRTLFHGSQRPQSMEGSPNFLQWKQWQSGQCPQPGGAWLYTVSARLQWVPLQGSVWHKWWIVLLENFQDLKKKKSYLFDMNIYKEANRYIGKKKTNTKTQKAKTAQEESIVLSWFSFTFFSFWFSFVFHCMRPLEGNNSSSDCRADYLPQTPCSCRCTNGLLLIKLGI